MEERYFAASNSESGFVSYFSDIFNPEKAKRIFIIKGGPGTGKSYFMKKIAEEAENKGLHTIRYYCSSDQSSLDGLVLDGGTAILDGTPPHGTDALYPGAVENIVDLGAFWDPAKLALRKSEIAFLLKRKKLFYAAAYDYLAASGKLSTAAERYVQSVCDKEKIERTAKRLVGVKHGSFVSKPSVALCNSIGMEGKIRFGTFEENAKTVYSLESVSGSSGDISHLLLAEIAGEAMRHGLDITLSYDPVVPSRLDAVRLGGTSNAIVFVTDVKTERCKVISEARFISKSDISPLKRKLRKINASRRNLEDLALGALADVKKVHFEIEEIYKSAMDFDAKEAFTESFISSLI